MWKSFFSQVVIDAFRTINPQAMALNQEPRQTTSNLGHLQKPSIQVRYTVARERVYCECREEKLAKAVFTSFFE